MTLLQRGRVSEWAKNEVDSYLDFVAGLNSELTYDDDDEEEENED